MTVNVFVKWAAVRYALVATFATGLLIGSVWCAAFVWQKIDNRARDARAVEVVEEFAGPIQEAMRKGDTGRANKLMEQRGEAVKRAYGE